MIRSDYPSNAQGNDQRDLLPYVLNIYSCLYPDDFTSKNQKEENNNGEGENLTLLER